MHFSLYVTVQDSYSGAERTYSYEIELPDKTPLGEVEGHVETVLRLLDKQSSETEEDDEDFTAG